MYVMMYEIIDYEIYCRNNTRSCELGRLRPF